MVKAKESSTEEDDDMVVEKEIKRHSKKNRKKKKKPLSPRTQLPFRQPDSIIAQVFALARRPQGVSFKEILYFAEKKGADGLRLIRILRKGEVYGKRWQAEEDHGRIKIHYPA